jgi:P27 family predicted phage terminase small subunit
MGLRGPMAKPIKLKILGGLPGKRPAPAATAKPKRMFAPGVPICPSFLSDEAKSEWSRVMVTLKKSGMLAVVDRAALASYCQAWGDLVEATETLNREGKILEQEMQTAKGEVIGTKKVPHPALRMQRDASARVKTFLAEFGFSPASRRRWGGEETGDGEGEAEPVNRLAGIRNRVKEARETGDDENDEGGDGEAEGNEAG